MFIATACDYFMLLFHSFNYCMQVHQVAF